MKKSYLALAATAVLGLTQTVAQATPFYIDNGLDYTGFGSAAAGTRTSSLANLGYSASAQLSYITNGTAAAGSIVTSTNISSTLTNAGFATTGLAYPFEPDELNINTLNTGVTNKNGFADGETAGWGVDSGGVRWGLTYKYNITGTLLSNGLVDYTGGFIDMYYQNGTTATKVAHLILTGSDNTTNNLKLSGKVDFSFVDPSADSFVKAFWVDAVGGSTFYDKWVADPDSVTWKLNGNESPNTITADQLVAGCTNADVGCANTSSTANYFRRSAISGTFAFNVPEPGSIALVGLTLTGLAVAARRRKQA